MYSGAISPSPLRGNIEHTNVVAQVGGPGGDGLQIFLKIQDDRVQTIKYMNYGCGAAIETSSIASVMSMGKTLGEVLQITEDGIAEALDGLPQQKEQSYDPRRRVATGNSPSTRTGRFP